MRYYVVEKFFERCTAHFMDAQCELLALARDGSTLLLAMHTVLLAWQPYKESDGGDVDWGMNTSSRGENTRYIQHLTHMHC